MPRYEFSEGTSNKFWEITLEGSSFTTRWGRIGTEGQTKTQSFDSPAEAKKESEKLIASKEKKGYALSEGGGDGDGAGEAAAGASNPELEAALEKNPDDGDTWRVYADWLQTQGDPRGELAAVKNPTDQQISKHAEALLGELSDVSPDELQLTWKFGHIETARLRSDYDSEQDVVETLRTLLPLPAARFIRGLVFGLVSNEGDNNYQDVIDALVELKRPAALRDLFLGDFEFPDENELSWSEVGDPAKLWKSFPQLRTLRMRGNVSTLGAMNLPELRELIIESCGMSSEAVQHAAKAQLPNIEKMELWLGCEERGGDWQADDLGALLEGKGVPKLKHLGLCNAERIHHVLPELLKSPLLKRLSTLSLSGGVLTDEDIGVLVNAPAALKHLEVLDLSKNYLSDGGIAQVKKLAKKVVTDEQRELDDPEYRYVDVWE